MRAKIGEDEWWPVLYLDTDLDDSDEQNVYDIPDDLCRRHEEVTAAFNEVQRELQDFWDEQTKDERERIRREREAAREVQWLKEKEARRAKDAAEMARRKGEPMSFPSTIRTGISVIRGDGFGAGNVTEERAEELLAQWKSEGYGEAWIQREEGARR
jgi:hypothetical protein